MQTMTVIAPSHWASALINGDESGLEPRDVKALARFLKRQGLHESACVDCEDYGFTQWHDASPECLACDCQTYTFLTYGENA